MADGKLTLEIEELKRNVFSEDWELVVSSVERLGKIGGDDIVQFLIALLDLANPGIRNRATLALEELKDNRAVQPLLHAIFKKDNRNHSGTMVFALSSLDCSRNFKDIFKILFYHSFEAKISACDILLDQQFDFDDNDLREVQNMWAECLLNQDLCPDFENSKVTIQEIVDSYLCHLTNAEE